MSVGFYKTFPLSSICRLFILGISFTSFYVNLKVSRENYKKKNMLNENKKICSVNDTFTFMHIKNL